MENHRIIRSATLWAFLILLLHPFEAYAENHANTVDITPYLGQYNVDSGLHYASGLAWGIGVGLNFTENIGGEFTFNAADSKYQGYTAQILIYRLDLIYHLTGMLPENVVPYFAAGTGISSYNNNQLGFSKEYDFLLNAGLGLKYYLSRNLALRGDARYIIDIASSEINYNLLYCAGLTFEFGIPGEEPQVAAPVEPTKEKEELCPQGPVGCVEKDWCKKDSDGDGVPDCIDKCPNTPKGTKVDANGCPPPAEQGIIIFRNIHFDFGKSDIKPESYQVLDQVVDYLKANPGIKMEVDGHTDNKGTPEYNIKLSDWRADSVRKYLMGKGVPSDRLEVKGFGLTKPIVPNDSEENRARNRRVEFKPI